MKSVFNITPIPRSFQTVLNMSNNLTKRHIVQKIYENADSSHREVSKIVQETLECITEALSSGKNVELRNFGVFELQVRKSRVGRNPNKPETDRHHSTTRRGQVQGRQRDEEGLEEFELGQDRVLLASPKPRNVRDLAWISGFPPETCSCRNHLFRVFRTVAVLSISRNTTLLSLNLSNSMLKNRVRRSSDNFSTSRTRADAKSSAPGTYPLLARMVASRRTPSQANQVVQRGRTLPLRTAAKGKRAILLSIQRGLVGRIRNSCRCRAHRLACRDPRNSRS